MERLLDESLFASGWKDLYADASMGVNRRDDRVSTG